MITLSAIDDTDVWSYIWGSPFFSTSKAYSHLTGHMPLLPFSDGYGSPLAKINTKFSFGYFIIIDSVPERFSDKEI